MNITKLLYSTYKVGRSFKYYITGNKNSRRNRYKPDYVFSQKAFGHVYLENMVANFNPVEDMIEIALLMGSATESNQKSVHRQAIALKGVNFEPHSSESLVNLIKLENPFLSDFSKEGVLDMVYKREDLLEGRTIFQKATTDKKFYVLKNNIDPSSVQVQVRCSCSNFYFMWAWYNAEKGCLLGRRPPAYKRKVRNSEGGIVTKMNPLKEPGVCKHLLLLIGLLSQDELLKDIPSVTPFTPKLGDTAIIRTYKGPIEDPKEVMKINDGLAAYDRSINRLKIVDRTKIDTVLTELKNRLKQMGQIHPGARNVISPRLN